MMPIAKGTSLDNLIGTALITIDYFDPLAGRGKDAAFKVHNRISMNTVSCRFSRATRVYPRSEYEPYPFGVAAHVRRMLGRFAEWSQP